MDCTVVWVVTVTTSVVSQAIASIIINAIHTTSIVTIHPLTIINIRLTKCSSKPCVTFTLVAGW